MKVMPYREIFKVSLPSGAPIPSRMLPLAEGAVKRLLSLKRLEDIYWRIPSDLDTRGCLTEARRLLGAECRVDENDLAKVPKSGPTVVIANHPYGGIEGVVMGELMLGIRPDVKIMANYLLGSIPRLRDLFIFVDPFENGSALERNLRPLREAMRWVEQGGLLVVFPAGEVAHLNLHHRTITDPQWNPAVSRIISRTKASVLPAFFHGCNGPLFQAMGLIHHRLRTALLPRQLLKPPRRGLRLTIGSPISNHTLAEQGDARNLTEYLRWRTYLLKATTKQKRKWASSEPEVEGKGQAKNVSLSATRREVDSLPSSATVAVQGSMRVLRVQKDQAPNLLNDVGRFREETFSRVGEGSGNELDLDVFDDYYVHLCLWDDDKKELAGGYRVGLTDEILKRHGLSGLYTATLFKFDPSLFQRMGPALELGRSFVRPGYQRSYSALLLLWKAIGRLVASMPRYRHIFGPVSVSNNYHRLSRRFMVSYFEKNLRSEYASLVEARRPPHFRGQNLAKHDDFLGRLRGMDELSSVVADMEGRGRGVPVLLQQYVKLAAKSAGWNLDPDFGNVIDCLLISDLTMVEEKTLARFCGVEGARDFLAYHHKGKPRVRIPLCA